MFKISEFSRLAQIPAKTLRYYDEIKLFQPAHIDRFTGYRYYAAEQLSQLNRILALKALGLSLEQIANLLHADLSAEQLKAMLQVKHAETLQRLQEEQQRLVSLESRLKQLEASDVASEYEVVVKQVAPVWVAALRGFAPDLATIGETSASMFGRLHHYLKRCEMQPVGAPIGLYHDEEMPEHQLDFELAIPISGEMRGEGDIRVYTLPGVKMMACTVHCGAYSELGKAYSAMMWWLETNNHQISTPNREIYLQYSADPMGNVTEIQYPLVV